MLSLTLKLSLRLPTLRQVGCSLQGSWGKKSGLSAQDLQEVDTRTESSPSTGNYFQAPGSTALSEVSHSPATGCPLSPDHFQSPQLASLPAAQGHIGGLCSALRSSRADDRSNDGCSPVIPDLHLQQQQHAFHHGHLEAASAQRGGARVAAGGTVWVRQEGAPPGPLSACGGPHQTWVLKDA